VAEHGKPAFPNSVSHQRQVRTFWHWYEWKRQLADGASSVFDKGTGQAEKAGEALVGELYRQIGQQKVELDFLARRLGR